MCRQSISSCLEYRQWSLSPKVIRCYIISIYLSSDLTYQLHWMITMLSTILINNFMATILLRYIRKKSASIHILQRIIAVLMVEYHRFVRDNDCLLFGNYKLLYLDNIFLNKRDKHYLFLRKSN